MISPPGVRTCIQGPGRGPFRFHGGTDFHGVIFPGMGAFGFLVGFFYPPYPCLGCYLRNIPYPFRGRGYFSVRVQGYWYRVEISRGSSLLFHVFSTGPGEEVILEFAFILLPRASLEVCKPGVGSVQPQDAPCSPSRASDAVRVVLDPSPPWKRLLGPLEALGVFLVIRGSDSRNRSVGF